VSKPKDLYIGYLTTNVRLFVDRCMAYSEKQAFMLLCNRIAKQSGVSSRIIFDYFKDHPEKYEVKKEIEFQEVEEETN